MAKKKKPQEYHVEVVKKARVGDDGEWEYLVKWDGYDSDSNSWEPQLNLLNCQRLLDSFWGHVGWDDKDYPIGYEIAAKPSWIEREKKYFLGTMSVESEPKSNTEKAKKGRHKKSQSPSVSVASSSKTKAKVGVRRNGSDDSDTPLSQLTKTKRPTIVPAKKRKALVISDDSDSADSSAQPPRKIPKQPSSSVIAMETMAKNKTQVNKGKQKEIIPDQVMDERPSSPDSLFSAASSVEAPLSSSVKKQVPVVAASISKPSVPSVRKEPLLAPSRTSRPQPKIRTLDLPQQNLNPGSGIATKQRIAYGSGATAKKPPQPPTMRKASLPTGISFKKVKPAPNQQEPTERIESPVTPHTPAQPESHPQDRHPDHTWSPTQDMHIDHTDTFIDDFSAVLDVGQHSPSHENPLAAVISKSLFENSVPEPQDPNIAAAERFLTSMMPDTLASPLVDSPVSGNGPDARSTAPISVAPVSKQPSLNRIPKKYKWSGEIFIDEAPGKARKLGDASLTDITEDGRSEGVRFAFLLSKTDSLRFGKLLDSADLEHLLQACHPIQQCGKLGPVNEKDKEEMDSLIKYLHQNHLVTGAPLFLDNASVALALAFPSTADILCNRFNIPETLRHSGVLILGLFPWAMNPAAYHQEQWRPDLSAPPLAHPSDPSSGVAVADSMRTRHKHASARYSRALKILKLPQKLHDWLCQSQRPYCIWSCSSDGSSPAQDVETAILHSIMDECLAYRVDVRKEARAVFVHLSALDKLAQLPLLVERRSKKFQVSFFTYGTYEKISPERWGVREVYPIGGVVTFTPSALLEDPMGTAELMAKISKHPLWSCYLLPTVVGMVAKMTYQDTDPVLIYDNGNFLYDYIVDLAAEGEVSILSTPPPLFKQRDQEDLVMDWVSEQLKMTGLSGRDVLQACVNKFMHLYANSNVQGVTNETARKMKLALMIEEDIISDLSSLQIQPNIMDEYRRFVVIKATTENHILWDRDGFEWLTSSEFDFRDDFFKTALRNL